ncbi:Centromere/kinetochore protein zw10-like protein [Forsythia ovata]|uniref:Centromere/kinetochore protein zw10-like protein n=1 Tax=Forsythia ovata TaxID=205694 RepID=A0ABD1WDM9_9LAMI
MDVLVNSIDVRDLLSSPDLLDSPSSPLSAPDLRLLITRLESHTLKIKSKVQSYLLSHHDDFSSLFSQSFDVVSRSEHLSGQVSELLNLISEHPIEAELSAIIKETVEKRSQVREKTELLELLGVVLELNDKLSTVKEDVRIGRIIEAAEGMKELKTALGIRNGDSAAEVVEGEPVVYGLLRNEWTQCFDEIQDLLLKFIEKAVQFEQETNIVHVKYLLTVNDIKGVELYTVFKAMDVLGVLDYGLAKVADLFTKYVTTPVIKCRSTPAFMEKIDQESGHILEAVLEMVPSADTESNGTDGETMYATIVQIIKFIYDSLCFKNGPWMRCFGRFTWPRMSELIISDFLSKVIPDDASKLAEFQKIRKLTSEFETNLKELMLIASSDIKDERLSKFADNVEVHFASRKKVEILAKARNLLLQSNFILSQEYVRPMGLNKEGIAEDFPNRIDLLFSSEKFMVSEAAIKLMELVHQTLKDVCLLPPTVGLEFYHAAKNALVLYEAVIPVKLERQLDSFNQAAVLIHNDCLYLSEESLGLAFEYRPFFPSSVKELSVFIDLAPRFQLMAEEVLQRQIQLVIYNLKEAIDAADGFQNTHQMKQFESAKFSIEQVAFIVEKVRIVWEPLLLPDIYEKGMSMVLEAVFSRIAKDILMLDDMAAEETLQLQTLIHLLFENLSSVVESLLAVGGRGKPQEAQRDTLTDFIPSLRKLRKLAELLDMPLKSITTAWESGELVECNFTLSELEDFIRSIFTDSPLRKECLLRINNSNDWEKEYTRKYQAKSTSWT